MTSVVSAKRNNRGSNWEAEFYKNGYPKEIIVIEDTPPPDQTSSTPTTTSTSTTTHSVNKYTVVPAPPAPSLPISPTNSNNGTNNNTTTSRSSKRNRNEATTVQDSFTKRRRKQAQPLNALNPAQQSHYYAQAPLAAVAAAAAAAAAATAAQAPPTSTQWERQTQQQRRTAPLADTDGHFIVRPGEFLTDRYQMQETLGQGTYGKVVKCYDHVRRTFCAIKIIRAIPKYREASQTEIRVLNTLKEHDQLNFNQCIHLTEWFEHFNHVCMVFELLDQSVFDFLKANHYEPFPINQIQSFAKQLLTSVAFVHDLKMIHTDLKPENILLKHHEYSDLPNARTKRGTFRVLHSTEIILIDFGSATFEDDYHSSVVSTRHYRAPEIILGLGWSYPCDIWSIGCILVEFFTGEALFQTHDNLEHLAMMETVLGKLPVRLAHSASRDASKYFKNGRLCYPAPDTIAQNQKYVKSLKSLKNTIQPRNRTNGAFLDLLQRMLTYDPAKRITARDALRHRFFNIEFDKYGQEVSNNSNDGYN